MSISPLYIPLFNIEEVILDKDTGLPLAAGVVKFYQDIQRLSPKVVYQITGDSPNYTFVSVGSELTLGLSGTFVDQDGDPFVPYAYPYDSDGEIDLYYVTVESEGGVSQFVREAVPYVDTGGISPAERSSTENEISNPQFVEINFPTPGTTTISVTGSDTVTSLAPGWDLITSGTGTVEIERLEPIAASVDTNPPYSLRLLASSGLGSNITLRQRFDNTPTIFRGGFASGSITVAVISGGNTFVKMTYAPSTGTSTEVIPSTSVSTDGAYHVIVGNAEIPDQTNDPANTGYVDVLITLSTSRSVAITSIQIVGTSDAVDIPFDEQPVARQKDHLFHYYENSIIRNPKDSILTGWDFPLNPWQFYSTTHGNVATNEYTCDQTIIIQQNYVSTGTGNNVAVSKANFTNQNGGFLVTAVTSHNQFGILQYVDNKTMYPYWSDFVSRLSSLLTVYVSSTMSTVVKFKMRLLVLTAIPSTTSQNYPVATWTEGGDPVFAGGITAIIPENDPEYTYGLLEGGFNKFPFNKIELPSSSGSSNFLGIFVYTTTNMDESIGDYVTFLDVSLVPNDFAIASNPKTADQVYRECQYYYQSTFPVGTMPAQAAGAEGAMGYAAYGADVACPNSVTFNLPVALRCTGVPIITTYSPLSANNKWENYTRSLDSAPPSIIAPSNRGATFRNAQTGADTQAGQQFYLHASFDARLGIINN